MTPRRSLGLATALLALTLYTISNTRLLRDLDRDLHPHHR